MYYDYPTVPRTTVLEAIEAGIAQAGDMSADMLAAYAAVDASVDHRLSDADVEALREYGRTTDYIVVGSFNPQQIYAEDNDVARACGCPVTAALHDNASSGLIERRGGGEFQFAYGFDDYMNSRAGLFDRVLRVVE